MHQSDRLRPRGSCELSVSRTEGRRQPASAFGVVHVPDLRQLESAGTFDS